MYAHSTENVNAQYVSDTRGPAPPAPAVEPVPAPSPRHWDPTGSWSEDELRAAANAHVVATWGPTAPVRSLPILTRSEGIYLYDSDGKEYLDWTSQAVCANLGHTPPPAVARAVQEQLAALPMAYGGLGLVEPRVRLAQLLSEICPGDINGFVFPSGGGEANEAAIRIARRFTGRHKILTQYRSYHGGSVASLAATGDFRRWFAEAQTSGFVKMFNSQPFGFQWGDCDEEKTSILLAMLEEQLLMEGPGTVAAIMLEPIVGAGGCLVPPHGYLEGVRALCDKYDVLLILDEVMVGFGRTGKMWAFQHFEGVVPDILTSAKGLSASYLPLSMVGVRQKVKDFLHDAPMGWGATYANHPVACACAYECVKHVVEHGLPERAARLEPVMVEEIQRLVDRHGSVRQGRAIGLFGCIDLVGPDGNMVQRYEDPRPPSVQRFWQAMLDQGLIGLFRPPLMHCAPPLVIEEDALRDGFARLDRALAALDEDCA
jgi:adenosylmethionine-8-amino-7-oxononanoate aminotransferase